MVFLWRVFDFWVEVSRHCRLQDRRLKYMVPVVHTSIASVFSNDSLSFICICCIQIQACMNLNESLDVTSSSKLADPAMEYLGTHHHLCLQLASLRFQ